MPHQSVIHQTFTIERSYPAAPSRVFGAFASEEAKNTWGDTGDLEPGSGGAAETEFDFRVGGCERFGFGYQGTAYRLAALYYDIVPDHRIVYSYEMYSGDDRMSVSLTTVEIVPDQDGTKLTYTEQGAFLDGIDKPEDREGGTVWILDNLGKYLAAAVGG